MPTTLILGQMNKHKTEQEYEDIKKKKHQENSNSNTMKQVS